MIKFNDVSFSYPGAEILKNFDISFEKNKINALIGPSGCGKTTLLNLIAGTLKIGGGQIENLPDRVSYVFQEPRLIEEKTVFQNLDIVLKTVLKDKAARVETIGRFLQTAEIAEYKNAYPAVLSGGTAQRVSLVRAFMYPSGTLLMDEPFKGLDAKIKSAIFSAFFALLKASPKTVVYVTHEVEEAICFADNITVLSQKPLKIIKKYALTGGDNKISGDAAQELIKEIKGIHTAG